MTLKFNGGHGAVVCNGCRTMIADGRHVHHPWAVQTDGPAVEHICSKDCQGRPRMAVVVHMPEEAATINGVVRSGGWVWAWPAGEDVIQVGFVPVRAARPIEPDCFETRGFPQGHSRGAYNADVRADERAKIAQSLRELFSTVTTSWDLVRLMTEVELRVCGRHG